MPRLLLVLLCIASGLRAAEPAWPAITSQTKPWSRWWWLGNIGTEQDFTSEMEKYAAAGLGGLEVTPIYGVRGQEARFKPYLSPEWAKQLAFVIKEGKRLGLGIDMSTGTGWPFGGAQVTDTDAAKYLAHTTYTVAAGERLAEMVQFQQKPVIRVAGPRKVDLAELQEPVTANANLQDLALDQVRFPKKLPLVSLMAFPANGAPLDLTNRVGVDGRLDWTAPAEGGPWTLYALFAGLHGKMVERAGPGGEGPAIDHFSHAALAHYLKSFEQAHAHGEARGLRAYFNDSYEVDDANGESDWTPHFLEEFQRRRGYDLRTQLPALFASPANEPARVLSDYRETVSDLLLDEFTIPWREWAHRQGALIRNQAHGSPANILDLYAASDIPEQEGTDLLSIKLASSAAHLMGKSLASAETATWLNEHFLSTFAELRERVDTFLLGGVNHNCYHGTAFSPPGEPWPGFQFYASVELNPANPLWADFGAFNAYVARAQAFLQAGHPDEDVLLYYGIHDRWAARGTGAMPHFSGRERDGSVTPVRDTGEALRNAGLGFDYVSDRLLEGVVAREKGLAIAGITYRGLVVPATNFMPLATLQRIAALAEAGVPVIFHHKLPTDAPGLHPKQAEVAAVLGKLREFAGDGRVLLGDDLSALVAHANFHGESLPAHGLQFIRRTNDNGPYYFLVNRGNTPVDGWVPFRAAGKAAAIFDPQTGRIGLASGRPGEVYLQLAPGASRIVQFYRQVPVSTPWMYWQPVGESRPLAGDWAVRFLSGGPTLPSPHTTSTLGSWTEWDLAGVKEFSGTATYTLKFARPVDKADGWQLDLGNVADSVRVTLNGRELPGVLFQPPFRVTIPAGDLQADNTLVVTVTNLAANRIADLDRRDPGWKKFYNTNMPARRRENAGPDGNFSAAKWAPRPSGLLGPVTLTPVRLLNPQ
ncbi:MAG TPA: glycosyl hydrolase [Lacunisphaera sp.]|nr:glycosyl hydrolase [Lacunisphaera sp.]